MPTPKNMEEEKNKTEYFELVAYLSDRIQKATNAVYRVTDLLPDKEPLKWTMREKAVSAFSGLVSSSDKDFLEKNNSLEEAESLIKQLVVLFSLFENEKSAFGMNFKILKKEYIAISEAISKERNSRDFYKIFWGGQAVLPEGPSVAPNARQENKSIGHDIGHKQKEMSDKTMPTDRQVPIGQNVTKEPKEIKEPKEAPQEASTADKRKEKIYKIIKDKGQVTVGELSSVFSEYSEKTIQRDLVEMVDKGILTKQGDKRWRTYLLKGA